MANFSLMQSDEFLRILEVVDVSLPIFPKEVTLIIALCAVGKIKKCMNETCRKEVLILDQHDTLKLNQDEYHDKKWYRYDHTENVKYFYDENSDIAACNNCAENV